MTHETWQVTLDTWHMFGGEHGVKIQVPCSNCLGIRVFWRFGGKGWIAEGVCHTAPATPGLLIRYMSFVIFRVWIFFEVGVLVLSQFKFF